MDSPRNMAEFEEFEDPPEASPLKRDSAWLEGLMDEGVIKKINVKKSKYDQDGVTALDHFNYKNGKKFEFVKCNNCTALLSTPSGGHWLKHQKKLCTLGNQIREVRATEILVKDAIVEYCLSSGSSFRQMESDTFRKLIRDCMAAMTTNIASESINLPCRQTVRDSVEAKCDETIEEIGKIIRPHIKGRKATLVLDFGHHIYNFLSAFVSYTTTSEQGLPCIKIEPFCFTPTYVVKTAENVMEELVRAGIKFDLTKEEILNMCVVSDGAANLSTMGKVFFKDWLLCACHAIQKMSERLLIPKLNNRFHYTDDELQDLSKCSDLIKKCAKLSLLVNKKKSQLHITKLPTVYIETRWQTAVKCARDVYNLIPLLKHSRIEKIAEMASEIEDEYDALKACIESLEKFEPLLTLFERTTVNIQLYLPLVYEMNRSFSQIEMETDNTISRVLNKSGRIVTTDYLENKISNMHLLATILAPRLKHMKKLSPAHQLKASKLLKKEYEKVLLEENLSKQDEDIPEDVQDKFSHLYDDMDSQSDADELTTFMQEKVTRHTPECPLLYWSNKKDEYPVLSQIALRVYSTVSSETICERAFSAVKRVVRDDRHRLKPAFIEKLMLSYFHANQYK